MKKYKFNLMNIAVSALFTAILCIMSQISVPTPFGVPLTLQTTAIALCGYILGTKRGVASVGTYILLGAVGVPVFSNFKGGIQALFGLTGGFIFGFLGLVFLCGLAKTCRKPFLKVLLGFAGILVCHLCGTIQFAVISKVTLLSACATASLPFILKDFIMLFAAFVIAEIINKRLKI